MTCKRRCCDTVPCRLPSEVVRRGDLSDGGPGEVITKPLPRYHDLPKVGTARQCSAWGVFGETDRVGRLGLVGPAAVRDAASLVRTGEVVSLNWPIDLPGPAILGRESLVHKVRRVEDGLDDSFDSFYPQGSSQWDSLCHMEHPELGAYNGLGYMGDAASVDRIRSELGIHVWATRGIAGRFVLADLAGYEAFKGQPIDCSTSDAVSVERINAVLSASGASLQEGDVLLVRFGWTAWYEKLSAKERRDLSALSMFPAPGLQRSKEMLQWLWDSGVAAVACDTPALEVMPFETADVDGFLHYQLIPLLGFAVGELFSLDALAEVCARTGRYEGFFVAAPLNMPGGIGSPANALAIL